MYCLFGELGMAFGTGNAVAHRAVDAVMGPRTIKHETVVSEAVSASPVAKSMTSCDIHSKAFQDVSLTLSSLSSLSILGCFLFIPSLVDTLFREWIL